VKLRSLRSAALLAGLHCFAAGAHAAPACEPDKLAQKYPSLVGKTIRIGMDPETPPYVFRDPKDFNKVTGSDVDLATAVMKCAGIKYTFFLGGWSGMMPAVIAGQIEIFWDNLYYTPERAKTMSYVMYMQAATGAMTQAGNPKKLDGLNNTSCGTTFAVGLGTVEEVLAHKQDAACKAEGKPGLTIMTYPDMASGIRLIQSRRADIMMTDLALVDSLVADHPDQYVRAFKIMTGFQVGAAVKNGNTDLLDAIHDGLQVLQATGGEKKIFEKYKIDPSLELPAEVKLD
jgi:polar amino acid transport system substrate-binding protein